MSEQFLKFMKNIIAAPLLVFSPSKLSRLSTCTSLLIVFIMTGCSSLHVDISPSVDWGHVRVIEFQSPPLDSWELTQPIKAELKAMGFQIEETHANPDLLFSYFTQDSPDLTVESEILTRLKSLHVQFTDPTTTSLVAAIDYFYPEGTPQSAPEAGVKEVFAGLQRQIHKEINSQSEPPTMLPTQTLSATPVDAAPPQQIQVSPTEKLKSNSAPSNNEKEVNATNNDMSKLDTKVEPSPEAATTVLKKPDKKSYPPVQKNSSPWLPKFKSWGFEDWGQDSEDSTNDY